MADNSANGRFTRYGALVGAIDYGTVAGTAEGVSCQKSYDASCGIGVGLDNDIAAHMAVHDGASV